MDLQFSKWQGTGNDFVVVDDRAGNFPASDTALITRLCDRHFGIGSDGLILVQRPREMGTEYHMEFFNPDGSKSFCGNGSRCAFAFWRSLVGSERARFTAVDGLHTASLEGSEVQISLSPPKIIERLDAMMDLIHTGSPHLLVWVNDPEAIDILAAARELRCNDRFMAEGVNVNFLRWANGRVEMRTYERGVEGETLSCGTGVTAGAIDAVHRGLTGDRTVPVHTRGGPLRVELDRDDTGTFIGVALIGPAQEVFQGTVTI